MLFAGIIGTTVFNNATKTVQNDTLLSKGVTLLGEYEARQRIEGEVKEIEERMRRIENDLPVMKDDIKDIKENIEKGNNKVLEKLSILEANQNALKENQSAIIPTVDEAKGFFTRYHREISDLINQLRGQ